MTIPCIKSKSSIEHVPANALGIVFAYVGERGAIPGVCREWEKVFNSSDTTYQILWAINNNSTVSRLLSSKMKSALQDSSQKISDTELRQEIQKVYEDITARIIIFPGSSIMKYAEDRLRGDPMIALALAYNARSNNKEETEFLQPIKSLPNNPKFRLLIASKHPEYLLFADDTIQNDKNFILAVITKNGFALKYVRPCFQDNYEIVMAAVEGKGCALQYASDRLKDDKEIVGTAVGQNNYAYEYASNRLKRDEDILRWSACRDDLEYLCHP